MASKGQPNLLHPITRSPCVDGIYANMQNAGCIQTYQADLPNSPMTKFRCTESVVDVDINNYTFYAVPSHLEPADPNLYIVCSDPASSVYIEITEEAN